MIIAGTGHRPDKLGGYGAETLIRLANFATTRVRELGPVEKIISGMALGWDTALALAALDLEIPLVAAIPFEGFEDRWSSDDRRLYYNIRAAAAEVMIVCAPGYAPYKMQRRNRWMVDRCDRMLALWNGSPGGTFNCLVYAEERQKPVTNVWAAWERLQ